MKIIKKLISFVLIVVIFMGGSLVNTQNVEAVSIGIYNSIESLPKNALDHFIDNLEKNNRFMLSRLGTSNVFGLMLIVNNKYYFLSEKAFMSTYSYKADQKSFADYTTALVDALNSHKSNADHAFYMLERKCTYRDEYRVKLSRMSQNVSFFSQDDIVIKGRIENSLTFKYYSDIKQIKVIDRTNNGLKVRPGYMLKETQTSNGAYLNGLIAEAVIEQQPTVEKNNVIETVKLLYSPYSIIKSINNKNYVSALFKVARFINNYEVTRTVMYACTESDAYKIRYNAEIENLCINGEPAYSCESMSPVYLGSKSDYYQIVIGVSRALTDNYGRMLTQFLLVPNYEESFS